MATVKRKKASADRRRYPRISMKLAVQYQRLKRGEISRSLKAQAEDFSAGGLAMLTMPKMRRGQLLMLNLYLPIDGRIKKNGDPLNFTRSKCQTAAILSRVAYCLRTKSTYKLGVQFLDLDKSHRKLLKAFLVNCKLLKADSRLYSC